MTGREAADEKERDEARARRQRALDSQREHDDELLWKAEMVAETQFRHSQREKEKETERERETLVISSPKFSEESNSSSITTTDESNDEEEEEPRRSGRVKKPSSKVASQRRREAEGLVEERGPRKKGKGKSKGRPSELAATSQLLADFNLPIRSSQ